MSDWPVMAAHHGLVKAVASALRQRCGLPASPRRGVRVLVGVSGGADSVALLLALAVLARRRTWRLELAVGHVQHHLRAAAEGDAQFVAELAQRLELPYLRADLELGAVRADEPANLEARARRQRYEALATMARTFGASYVAVAHHGDDQIETVLMRLLRGASVRGLGGMAWRRRLLAGEACVLIRPMLGVDRAMAVEFLQALGQRWREDHTNSDQSRLRARLRAQVLPGLRAACPDVGRRVVAAADHLRQVAKLVEGRIEQAMDHVVYSDGNAELDRVELQSLPRVVVAGVLRALLSKQGAPGDRLGMRTVGPIVRAIRDTAGGQRRFTLARGITVTVTRQAVRIGRKGE